MEWMKSYFFIIITSCFFFGVIFINERVRDLDKEIAILKVRLLMREVLTPQDLGYFLKNKEEH